MNPSNVEHYAHYSAHLGPRYEAAGLRVQFHGNQTPGIHFKVSPREEHRESILMGLQDGLASRFPDYLKSGSLWVTEVTDDEIDSSPRAFYKAARLVIDQAYSLRAINKTMKVVAGTHEHSRVLRLTEDIRLRTRRIPFEPFRIHTSDNLEYLVPTAEHVHVFPNGSRVGISDDEGNCVMLPGRSISELV